MFEKLDRQKKLEKAKEMFQDAVDSDIKWQRRAREDFYFRDGNQWTEEEQQILEQEMRPVLTFNLTKSLVDLVIGMNEDSRVRFRARPVDPTDSFLAEVLNDISDWLFEQNDIETEEDNALHSATICGRGYNAIDFVPNPKRFGEILINVIEVPVHEVHFDPAARRRNLSDASYIFWDKWLSREQFKLRYPKINDNELDKLVETGRDMSGSLGGGLPSDMYDVDRSAFADDDSDYDTPMDDMNFYDRAKNQIRVVHMEYWTTFRRYFFFDPETQQVIEFDSKEFNATKNAYEEKYNEKFVYETMMDKRVRWLQFNGDRILFDDFSPMPFDGFSIVPMIAYRDESKRTANHFGIVRMVHDPQREVNKRWSQTLNMLNNQVQTGIFAETDAFVDNQQAELSMKDPGGITWVNSGAIAQGKIKERTLPAFPNAPMLMEEHSERIIKQITGINPDLLGQDRGRQEPGIVVRLRQQQGITLLKPLFKNFNEMKKQLFERVISVVCAYMPDSQILRILGGNDRYQINQDGLVVDSMTKQSANIRAIRDLNYNIIGEEAPGNMTKQMMELSVFLDMLKSGFPVDPNMVIEKLDLGATDKQRWLQYIQETQNAQIKSQEEAMLMQQQMAQADLAVKQEANEIDREGNVMDMIVKLAKINQMDSQTDVKSRLNLASFVQNNQKLVMDYISKLAQIEQQGQIAALNASQRGSMNNERKKT